MRKYSQVRLCIAALCLAAASAVTAAPAPPTTVGESVILVDSVTGRVLYEKRCRTRRPPASTTKIMTAILALENGNLDDVVQVSARASETRFSSLHLKPGEKLTLESLLYGLLLRSGNDAAVCTAEHIAGSEKEFVEMMNERAKELGAKDTHFVNPHGLHNAKHYSTAFDLTLIARHAIRIPKFNEIVQTKTTHIERSTNSKDAFLRNTARFLWKFDGADGIKTGYTREAGRCFVGSATRDGWRLIAVVLKSNDAGADTTALLNFGFKYFKGVCFAQANEVVTTVDVHGGIADKVDLLAADDLALVFRKSAEDEAKVDIETKKAVAPIAKGEKLGTFTGYLNGKKVGSVDLLAAEPVDRSFAAAAWIWIRSMAAVSILFLAGYVSYGTAVAKAARRRRRSLASRS